jgi:hypothetical protein
VGGDGDWRGVGGGGRQPTRGGAGSFRVGNGGEATGVYIGQAGQVGHATNGSCCEGPKFLRARPGHLTGWSGGPSTTRWLVSCQA